MITPNGNLVPATVVHHIIPLEVDPSKIVMFSNLIPLCDKCHTLAHALLSTKNGRKEYAKVFNVNEYYLTKKRDGEKQDFFTREECRRNAAGKVFCRRMGKYKDEPCPVCYMRKIEAKSVISTTFSKKTAGTGVANKKIESENNPISENNLQNK